MVRSRQMKEIMPHGTSDGPHYLAKENFLMR